MISELRDLELPRRRYWLDALIVACLTLGLAFILLWHTMFVMIPAGSVGVLYRLFGGGTDTTMYLPEGLAFKMPWDIVYLYEARTQSRLQQTALTSAACPSGRFHDTLSTALTISASCTGTSGRITNERKVLPNVIEILRKVSVNIARTTSIRSASSRNHGRFSRPEPT